jgi:hypothetical protein
MVIFRNVNKIIPSKPPVTYKFDWDFQTGVYRMNFVVQVKGIL